MSVRMVLAAVALCAGGAVLAQAPVMTNADVVALVKAGVPEEAVIARIRSGATKFDLSNDGLIALKASGVSGAVMAAMIAPASTGGAELSADSPDPNVPHYPGLYMLEAVPGDGKMTRINPTVSNQAKANTLGTALTLGIVPTNVNASIQGASARLQTGVRTPVFFAFFEESVPRGLGGGANSTWASGVGTVTSSPSEVTLVRFTEKEGRRTARVGKVDIVGVQQGVNQKDQIPFESEMVRPGVFKLTVKEPLAPGEYGFIQALQGTAQSTGITIRVFDFGIEGPATPPR